MSGPAPALPAAGGPEAAGLYLSALLEGLVQGGVRHLVFCPGSRSTPVLLAAHRNRSLRLWQHVDERSAAFFALGVARVLAKPVALLATSGTAAANFLPAVVEARYGRVPLVVLTADRPRELREVGAPQTIDQVGLYGSHAKMAVDLPLPEGSPRLLRHARATAARAAAQALDAPAGPVHLNLPLREPLIPRFPEPSGSDGQAAGALAPSSPGRPEAVPVYVEAGARHLEPAAVEALARELASARRGLVVVGPQDDPGLAGPLVRLAAALGWPLLADPLSQLRDGPAAPPAAPSPLITAYDAFLRIPGVRERLRPQAVFRLGAAPVSKALNQYLEQHAGIPHWVVDPAPGWRDPAQAATRMLWAEPRALVEALVPLLPGRGGESGGWLEGWRRLETASSRALAGGAPEGGDGGLAEEQVFAELMPLLPEGALLMVGNSMPVRDLDTFHRGGPRPLRILANRGASGIDGVVSTALGAAAAGRPKPAVLVVGDLSFYHDLNGLLAARLHGIPLTVVLIHNDGGGIFSFLPQAGLGELFEPLFGTPTGLDFRPAVEMYGGRFLEAPDREGFRRAIRQGLEGEGLTVVQVPGDRKGNAARHRALWRRVEAEIAPLLEALPS